MEIISQDKLGCINYDNYEFVIKPNIKNSIFEIWATKTINKIPEYIMMGRYNDLGTVTFILNRLRECYEQGAKKVQITSYDVIKII